MAEIQQAFEVLSDARSRIGYDRQQSGEVERSESWPPAARKDARRRRDVDGSLAAREIPLGFPAMSRWVTAVLSDFFGGDGNVDARPVHQTEVAVTARQAREGGHVPVLVPLRPTCPACGGRGESWAAPCGICEGTGSGLISHRVQLPIPPGVRDGARLRFSVAAPFAGDACVELRIAVQ